MELVNNKYIEIDRFDIFGGQVEASDQGDKAKMRYFDKLIRTLLDYEKQKKKFIMSIYIDKDSDYAKKYVNFNNITIRRQAIINAILLAMLNNDIDIAIKLKTYIYKKSVLPTELGDMLDYVLEHNIDICEYLNGENLRIIYNDKLNKFEKGYIYNNSQSEKKLVK